MNASSQDPGGAQGSPATRMHHLVSDGVRITKALYVVARLRIADLVSDAPKTATELAQATDVHAPSLYRVLRTLASIGVFAEDEAGRFALTPLGATLESGPGSLRHMAIFYGAPWHWRMWDGLLDGVRTGRSGVKEAEGVELFEYLAANPDAAREFDESMTSASLKDAAAIAAAYDFSTFATLVDVGGGQGALLGTILKANPALRGVLFDLPSVMTAAERRLGERGVAERCRVVGGDMFETVPDGADAYIMRNVIHDWDDADCLTILRNCRRAMAPGAKLLVVQEVLPLGNAPSNGKLLDVQMLLIGGKERTEAEFRSLYADAGFRLTRIVATETPHHIIEGIPD